MPNILLSSADAGSLLSEELARLGARLLHWPELKVDEPGHYFALDDAIENLFGYDWLVLKNESAADFFLRRFRSNHLLDELDDLRTLVVGDSAAELLVNSHVHVDVAIDRFSSAGIFAAVKEYAGDLGGLTFLIPSAGLNAERFEQQLEEAGARVDNVPAYRTTSDNQRLAQLIALLTGGGVDGVIFTNSKALDELGRLLDTHNLSRLLLGASVVCAGEETARAADRFGLTEYKMMPGTLTEETFATLIKAQH